jgi:hypothetical protein
VNKGSFHALVAALVAAALIIAGCGSDDDASASLTTAQFKKQANAICKRQEERRASVIQKAVAGLDQKKLLPLSEREDLVLETLPPYEEMAEELKALGAPEGDEQKLAAITTAMEKAAGDVTKDPASALTSTQQFDDANKLATDYGLTECVI